jgi:formylmethanofuran dehydrogenase subunit D
LLLTGRTIYQGVAKEKGKFSEEYLISVAICEIDPQDMEVMNIKENRSVRVTTRFGSIIVNAPNDDFYALWSMGKPCHES